MSEKRGRGQPKFEPTPDQRSQGKLMKAMAIPEDRAFAAELESGATEVHALVGNFIICAILGKRPALGDASKSEQVRMTAAGLRRIALVGPTVADARNVMVEGESGILAISPNPERPLHEPSKRRLTWPNGAVATTYSADEPERLRGPQHDAAWCDELAAWRYPEAWDMLMFGMRPGATRVPW
jgi:phage terminase large subunit-like protein